MCGELNYIIRCTQLDLVAGHNSVLFIYLNTYINRCVIKALVLLTDQW